MVAMTMANTTEEPILFRMDRLDTILRQLEEIRASQSRSHSHSRTHTPKSSSLTSTPSRTSEGGNLPSSAELISPESLEKHCRPIEHVMMETDAKGSLIERLDHVEDRVLKLCVQLEEEFMESSAEKKRDDEAEMIKRSEKEREKMIRRSEKEEKIDISEVERTQIDVIKKKKKKGLKQLIKQSVMGKGKPNKSTNL